MARGLLSVNVDTLLVNGREPGTAYHYVWNLRNVLQMLLDDEEE